MAPAPSGAPSSAPSGATQRPTFYEGQIISADDLNILLANARVGLAQHERYLHTPGIAFGLTLAGTARQTLNGDDYQEIVLAPGLALDGNGRHLVVSEARRLSEDDFADVNVAINNDTAWYPVFLSGRDEAVRVASAATPGCGTSGASRIAEVVEVGFGRVDQADPGNKVGAGIGSGPEAPGAPWRVLLGFVQWSAAIKRFTKVQARSGAFGPAYCGVRADTVQAQSGVLSLQSQAAPGKPALELDGTADGELRFGMRNSSGSLVPVFSVKANGDLFAAGKISGAVGGGAQFQSGSAMDGMLLPLPPGITQAMVDAGNVTVIAHVTPHYGVPALPVLAAPHRWFANPIECRVDGARRVHCRTRWTRTDGGAFEELPGTCDFQLTALVAKD